MSASKTKSPPKPPRPTSRGETRAARLGAAQRAHAKRRQSNPAASERAAPEFKATSLRPRRLSMPDAEDEASERETLPAPAPAGVTLSSELGELGEVERSSMPEIVFSETTAGPELIAAIAGELEAPLSTPEPATPELLELVTFLARGSGLERLNSESARLEFVAERLLHRLPVRSMAEVDHVDLAPWTVSDTMVVRVWCKIAPLARE